MQMVNGGKRRVESGREGEKNTDGNLVGAVAGGQQRRKRAND